MPEGREKGNLGGAGIGLEQAFDIMGVGTYFSMLLTSSVFEIA